MPLATPSKGIESHVEDDKKPDADPADRGHPAKQTHREQQDRDCQQPKQEQLEQMQRQPPVDLGRQGGNDP